MLILLWSAFGVFSQLAFVRLFSTTAGETAYYGNTFFIVAVFSLSSGFFARGLSKYSYFIPLFILLNYFTILWLGSHFLLQQMQGEFQWDSLDWYHNATAANFDLQLAILILCTTLAPVMVLIGAKQGEHMVIGNYRKKGYLLMAGGGILGALVFTAQNQFLPSQWVLFVLWTTGFLAIMALERDPAVERARVFVAVLPILACLAFSWVYSAHFTWSPYQRISTQKTYSGNLLNLFANGGFISSIQLQTASAVHQSPSYKLQSALFDCFKPEDRVLILGSGGGTHDVREALFKHVRNVTAVEIDPQFIQLGERYDPDRSYFRPEVTKYVNDARRFINTCDQKFDCIYVPFLDSHTNASNQSRFRLDSFLYTKEGLRMVYSKLSDHGVLFVSFGTYTSWLRQRMFNLLQEATGADVHAFALPDACNTTFAVGHGRTIEPLPVPYFDASPSFARESKEIVPTDDWPFFYSQFAGMPKEYLRLVYMICLLLLAVFFICRNGLPSPLVNDTPAPAPLVVYAFFSGAAFFFIQIRTISALTPWFGATYISQAMVITGIILSSLAGALLAASRRPLTLPAAWVLLFATIALGFLAARLFHPLDGRLFPSAPVFMAVLLLPTFFAGYIYLCYLDGLSSSAVLQLQLWNLVGGALGGLAEGIVIYTGFYDSLWVVAAFYALALLAAQLGLRLQAAGSRMIPTTA